MSELRLPKLRMGYEHTPTGKIYVVWGMASQFKDKNFPDDKVIVILASLENGEPLFYSLDRFFDKHPHTGIERFRMVTPT